MIKVVKAIACLYAGMVAANAEQTVRFDGTKNQGGLINFEVENHDDRIILKRVSINQIGSMNVYAPKIIRGEEDRPIQITLEIPAIVDGRRVVIGEPKYIKGYNNQLEPVGAFSDLSLHFVELAIKFIGEGNNHVQFPENCSGLFSRSGSITEISGIYSQTQVTNMRYMFRGCDSLTSLDLSNFNTQSVTDMQEMFRDCISLKGLDLSNFNTQNVTNMSCMFEECSSLHTLDLSNFNTQNVKNMQGMFGVCESLTNLDLSNFNTQNVENMQAMFLGCNSLTNLDLSNFNTQNVKNMRSMFWGCSSLANANVPVPQGANKEEMFNDCCSLLKIMLGQQH